jgi:hypothetical protein
MTRRRDQGDSESVSFASFNWQGIGQAEAQSTTPLMPWVVVEVEKY